MKDKDFTSAEAKEALLKDKEDELNVDNVKVREMISISEIPTPEEYYVIKEVTFNSDVVNNEFCIFFPTPSNMLTLFCYPASTSDLAQTIRDAVKFFLNELCYKPSFVLIPFHVYICHSSVSLSSNDEIPGATFEYVCDELGLQYKIMVPDRLRTKTF